MSNLTSLTSLNPDDGYWFGLGAFETIWVKHNTAVFLDEHLNRLKKSALFLGFLKDETSANQWILVRKQEISDYLKENPMENGVLKLTFSDKNLSLTSRKNTYTKEQYEKGFALDYSKILRNETSPFTYMKTLNYADNILEKRLAKQRGYDEPVFLNTKGELSEGATTNLFFVSDEKLFTPALSCGLLDGIVRQYVLKHYEVEECVIRPEQISDFDEMFVTNSLLGIMPVCRLGEHKFTRRTVTNQLMQTYSKI